MEDNFRMPTDQTFIVLPPPSPQDTMCKQKKDLLHERRLALKCDLTNVNAEDITDVWLDGLLEAARVLELTDDELYFLEDGDKGPFSPRNEIEALHALELASRTREPPVDGDDPTGCLAKVHDLVLSRLNGFGSDSRSVSTDALSEAETELCRWAEQQGIKSSIQPAIFEGTGRGGAASTNIEIGDLVLEIPKEALIGEDVALNSEMGPVLREISGLAGETMSLLWSMKERHNKTSRFAPFFKSLPESFHTGLGFGDGGLEALEGTLVVQELNEARKHLREHFDAFFPALSDKHPDLFPADLFTWDHFLWACQLWYSYSTQVKYPSGAIKLCLVPIASLLNHSIYPHITHFSKIKESTDTLQLFALRRCKVGEQCFLSYGPLQNSELLPFYGFLIRDNPYDVVLIDPKLNKICGAPQQALLEKYNIRHRHMVRGYHCLPTQLIAALRVACMEEEELLSYSADPRKQMITIRNEREVYNSLLSTLDQLLKPLQDSAESLVEAAADGTSEWDVRLALQYKRCQRRVLESVRSLCEESLESLHEES